MMPAKTTPDSQLPYHLRISEKDCDIQEWLEEAQLALTTWGLWWLENQDQSTGLGYPSMTPSEKMLHPSGPDWGDLPPMPLLVEQVDHTIRSLPWEWRITAWVWFVVCRETGVVDAAHRVSRQLDKPCGQALFRQWLGNLLAVVQGKLFHDINSG